LIKNVLDGIAHVGFIGRGGCGQAGQAANQS